MSRRRIAVLALVTEAFGGRGGIAQYNRDLIEALAGHVGPLLVLPRLAPDAPASPQGVEQAPPRPSKLGYLVETLRLAFTHEVELVFCGHLFMAPLALLVCRITGARLVLQVHGIEAWSAPSPLRRYAAARSDLVLCVSRDTRRRVLAWLGGPPERVAVLANTVRPIFRPGDRGEARRRMDLPAEAALLLSVGRLSGSERYKGQDRVIAALPSLTAARPGLTYVVAGDGDDRPRLEALAKSLGVQESVRFLGAVADADLVSLYQAVDLFVLPSTGEGFGIVFLEAMASGTPALGFADGGAADALGDGRLGHIADPADLAGAILAALDAPPAARGALPAAVEARFGRAAFAGQARALIERARGGTGSGSPCGADVASAPAEAPAHSGDGPDRCMRRA